MTQQQLTQEQQAPFHWDDLTQKIRSIFGNTYRIQHTPFEHVYIHDNNKESPSYKVHLKQVEQNEAGNKLYIYKLTAYEEVIIQ